MSSINFYRDWIVDSGYNSIDYVEKQGTNVINKKQIFFEDIQTGDVVASIEEIK